jgi:hypothetical protein
MKNTKNKEFYINDLKVLIPDLKNTLNSYLYSKADNENDKKIINSYPNQSELWNLRVLKSQLTESIEYVDKLINSYQE